MTKFAQRMPRIGSAVRRAPSGRKARSAADARESSRVRCLAPRARFLLKRESCKPSPGLPPQATWHGTSRIVPSAHYSPSTVASTCTRPSSSSSIGSKPTSQSRARRPSFQRRPTMIETLAICVSARDHVRGAPAAQVTLLECSSWPLASACCRPPAARAGSSRAASKCACAAAAPAMRSRFATRATRESDSDHSGAKRHRRPKIKNEPWPKASSSCATPRRRYPARCGARGSSASRATAPPRPATARLPDRAGCPSESRR